MNTFTASQKQFIFDVLTKVKRDEENLHLAYKNVYNILNEHALVAYRPTISFPIRMTC
jgi:hypothetical protein